VGVLGVAEMVAESPQSIGVATSTPQLMGIRIQKTAQSILKTALDWINLFRPSFKFVLICLFCQVKSKPRYKHGINYVFKKSLKNAITFCLTSFFYRAIIKQDTKRPMMEELNDGRT
jgi:hypothetical protein